MKTYGLGTSVKVSVRFGGIDGTDNVPFDPSTVECHIKAPDGTETTYTFGVDAEVVKTAVGFYHLWVTATTQPGLWAYRWDGRGNFNAGKESVFYIEDSVFATP